MIKSLAPFFSPSGAAIIGASANPAKLSHGILKNLIESEYKGAVYPVNPGSQEILGRKCYADISTVPDPLDLAVSILPAPATPAVLEACGQRGLKAVIIISGGFREVGSEGLALENECLTIARRYGMRLIGPNCVGTIDLYSGLNTTFIKGVPECGYIGFLSQSGAICGAVIDYVRDKGIGFSNFTSLGNEADVDETDVIEYLAEDPNTKVIAAYLEAIRDGRRFMEVAARVSRRKPIVVLKVGNTEAGARAVSSHTGSLAGSQSAYQAAFLQSGVITVHTAEELFDVAAALVYQPLPEGERVAIVTNSGGPAALASDSLSLHGLKLAELKVETKNHLRQHLIPSAQVDNPVDMLGGAEPKDYQAALDLVLADDQVDAVISILTPQALVNPADVAKTIIDRASKGKKTVLSSFMGGESVVEARQVLHRNSLPMYIFPERTGQVLGSMLRYRRWLEKPDERRAALPGIDPQQAAAALARAGGNVLGEADARPLLSAYGISLIPGDAASSPQQAAKIAGEIGFPVALKIISPDILHKSDAGGILLGLEDADQVESAAQEMMERIAKTHPQARLLGFLVEKMAPKGYEVIIGMKRDPSFGPLLMFGMGGILVELVGDIAFRVAPLSRQQAQEMILATKAGRLLGGLRGSEPGDIDALVDCTLRLGQLSLDRPEIAEIEINPLLVMGRGQGVFALDARAILGEMSRS